MSLVAEFEERQSFQSLIAMNIRVESARRGLKQKDIANALGITGGAVSLKWSGKRQWSAEDIERIAHYFGIEPWDLCMPDTRNGAQTKLNAVPNSYTARDLNPEPSD